MPTAAPNKSFDASGGSVFRHLNGPALRQTFLLEGLIRMRTKTKIISIAAAALVFLSLIPVGAVLGYRFYRTRLLKEKIEEAIGRDAGYTETIFH